MHIPAVAALQLLLRRLHGSHGCFIVGRVFEQVRRRVIRGEQIRKFAQSLDGGFENRVARFEHRFLRNESDAQSRPPPYPAIVGRGQPGEDLQQARLAGAVAADQPDAAARLDYQIGVVQQRHVTVG